ncbi:hypothetical protein F503_03413 [Ophiostoma piceae UAMH 11346]|uniref:Uncharacterized protein n=1 Tax=Ophiostoma piceae (strain UAMH 11346) TaxID=1262450 RepID=S3C561_OPHP1|nr:hypothetical protein F503_03413 [Ophiostoma piceae UAMH 11346]
MASHFDGESRGRLGNIHKLIAAANKTLESLLHKDEEIEAARPRTIYEFSFTTYESHHFPISEFSGRRSRHSGEEQDRIQSTAADGNQPDGNPPDHVSALTKDNIHKLNRVKNQGLKVWDGLLWTPSLDCYPVEVYSKITDTIPAADLERHRRILFPKSTTQPGLGDNEVPMKAPVESWEPNLALEMEKRNSLYASKLATIQQEMEARAAKQKRKDRRKKESQIVQELGNEVKGCTEEDFYEVRRDEDIFTIGGNLSDISTYSGGYKNDLVKKDGPSTGPSTGISSPEELEKERQDGAEIVYPPHVGSL